MEIKMQRNNLLYCNFIKSSRILLPKRPKSYSNNCKVAVETLLKRKSNIIKGNLRFIECCSLNKYPSINFIPSTSEVLLIYDQYIELINRIFNHFYENHTEINNIDIEKLIYGLCAEDSILSNNKKGFVYSAINFNSRAFSFPIADLEYNEFLVEIQMYFMIFHEYCHFAFLNKIPEDIINTSTENMQELITDIINNILANVPEMENDDIKIFESLKLDQNFIEECWCDLFALKIILEHMNTTINTPAKRLLAIKAIFYNLNTLNLILLVKNVPLDISQKLDFQTLVRMSVIKNILPVYDIPLSDLDSIDSIMREIEHSFGDTYCKVLFDVQDQLEEISISKKFHFYYNKLSDWYNGL